MITVKEQDKVQSNVNNPPLIMNIYYQKQGQEFSLSFPKLLEEHGKTYHALSGINAVHLYSGTR